MSSAQSNVQTDMSVDIDGEKNEDAETVKTNPTLKPTVLNLVAVFVIGVAAIVYLLNNPNLLGTTERTQIGTRVLIILTFIGMIRFIIRMYVLKQTQYIVTSDAVRREYSLLYKTFSRELPLNRLRSHELSRSRIETLLGIGSVAFLTGSLTQSPAHLEFKNVPDPERIRRHVRDRLPKNKRL